MYDFITRHRLADAQSIILVPLVERPVGVYYSKLDMAGNSILSTVFVENSTGGTVLVEYFDFTTGDLLGELGELRSHIPMDTALTWHKTLVSNTHDKVIMRITVTGGPIKFSVYGTVKNSTVSDLDAALVSEDEVVNFLLNKGIPIGGIDEVNNVWRLLRIDEDGNLFVRTLEDVTTPNITNFDIVLANTEYSHTFPSATKRVTIQNRDNGLVKFCFIIGETATKFISLFPGQIWTESGIGTTSLTIYFQSPKSNQVLEMLSWV